MRFKFLAKYFPSPEYLKPPHIGLSFSDENIKAFYYDKFAFQKSGLSSLVVPLAKGAIVSGKIVNREEVVNTLRTIKEHFKSSFVFFAIPDELAYIFSVSVPVNKETNLYESVAFNMEESIPLSPEDTVFDFIPVATEAGPESKVSLVAAACQKDQIAKFSEAIRVSDLEPVGCAPESQVIAQSLVPKKSKGATCIIHARGKRIGIYLVENRVVRFATIRPIIDGDYERQFSDEYEKFLEYTSKYQPAEKGGIQTTLICGEFAYAKRIAVAEALADKSAKLANVWVNILDIEKNTPEINFEESLNLAGPVGAVLADIF